MTQRQARAEAAAEVAAIEAAILSAVATAMTLTEVQRQVIRHAAADRKRLADHAACSDLGRRACDVRAQLLDTYGVSLND